MGGVLWNVMSGDRVSRLWLGLGLLCGIVTVVAAVPVHMAYRSVTLHASLDAAASVVATVAVFLVFGRLRRRSRLSELLLASGLGLLALGSLIFAVITALNGTRPEQVSWDGRIDGAFGVLLLAAAAFAPRRELRRGSHSISLALASIVAVGGAVAIIVALLGHHLSPGVRVLGTESSGSWPNVQVSTGVVVRHATDAALFALASVGFLRRFRRQGDEFYAWLAITLLLLSFAEMNYAILPSRFTGWVFAGDGFRLMGYVVLFAGAMREIRSYWQLMTRAAILDDRRRIARDLHDGLAQEIAYIQRNLASLASSDSQDDQRLIRIQRAAERAQLESRKTFAALATPLEEPVDLVLRRAVSEIAGRFGTRLDLDLVPDARIDPDEAESVVRIACEAVANAARHSGSERVALTLDRRGPNLRLRVQDFGRGFDPTVAGDGFGLISMRERARAIGGELRVESEPGQGTTVELAL
jgi:signal transduction histidine kinase